MCGKTTYFDRIPFFLLRKNQRGTSKNVFSIFMEILRSTEAPLVVGRRERRLSKHEQQSSVTCLARVVLSQIFVLKCCSELMSLFARISESQPNNWRSVFETAKGNVFKSFVILGIGRFALDGFPGPHSQKQNRGKSYFFRVTGTF
jgi:hypothetical protein